ncbi:MAG: hypothetical protein C0456_10375 [Hyphomonas sp.]|uniref:hypothetical protein n=1 Tax=Hyphomonas sp. TaxID=87 RepID=UPI001DEF83EF|nr:hypothetical protein [Hyphomonas sp.]MBA4227025.1 hypothetical protein [Hyphomonas sp.]
MTRFLIIFAITLGISFALMASVLTQNGYSMFAPEMQTMIAVCIAVALYVAWRISNVLRRRQEDAVPGAEGSKKPALALGLGSLTGGKSRALREREARVAARRRRLIQEGKLQEEEPAAPEPPLAAEPAPPAEAPTRAASTATMKEKMAARAERVRRAREEGKI